MPTGYTQIPSTGLFVRNDDGSGPFYQAANGTMTAFTAGDPPAPSSGSSSYGAYLLLLLGDD